MTTWTSPQTDTQKRYYSKRKGKLRAYEITAVLIQIVWAYYDFPAYNFIFQSAFESIPALLWTAPWVSALLLIVMHYILRETYITYWFDKLDNDEETDSSPWIPLVLIALLFVAGRYGVKMSVEAKIPAPVEKTYVEADQVLNDRNARLTKQYDSEKSEIEQTYRKKAAAATISIDNRIATLQRRRADDDQERRRINAEISTLRQRRADAIAPIEQAQADALSALLDQRKQQQLAIDHDYNQNVDKVNLHNETKNADHAAAMTKVGWGSWLLSFFFVFIYCALGYAIVSIKVTSGILPQRDHTVLDQYGGTLGRALYVFQDIFNRQFYRLTLLIHRLGTYGTSTLSHMDATYHEIEADYNSIGLPAPAPQPPTKTDVEALKEVMEKMVRTRTQLSPDDVAREVELAKMSNGHYRDLPFQNGKKPEAPAGPTEHPAGATRYAAPAATQPDYPTLLSRWKGMVEAQLSAHDAAIREGRPGHAKAIAEYVFTDPTSAVVKEGKRLKLEWCVLDREFQVRHKDRGHWVPLDKLTESTLLSPIPATDSRDTAAEEEELFKQTPDLFKQKIKLDMDESGEVIGIKYRKDNGQWTSYSIPTVEANLRIYRGRVRDDRATSRAVIDGIEKWQYALDIIEKGRAERSDLVANIL